MQTSMISGATIDDEAQIVDDARKGNIAAQKALYSLHIRYLAGVCSRYILNSEDVKDVLQESFLKIFSSLPSFIYRGKGSTRGWMCRIVINETLKFLRKTTMFEFTELTEAESSRGYDDYEPDINEIPTSAIHEMIRELPSGYRTIFNLYVIENKSHKEIAALLNIKESTSASQLHRAKAILASRIKEYRSTLETATL